MLLIFIHFISGFLPVSLAQSALPAGYPQSQNSGQVQDPASNRNDNESIDPLQHYFQLAIHYGMGNLSLDVNGDRALPKAASPTAYEDGQPVSGSFEGGSVKQVRTVASMLLPYRGRSFSFGIGLEDLDIGNEGSALTKSGGTDAGFHMNSLIFELGAIKNFNRWGQALVALSYDHALGGKLRSRYATKVPSNAVDASYSFVTDALSGGGRFSISGNYQFNLLPGFSFGLFTSAQYGVYEFAERDQVTTLFGLTSGLSFMLKI